MDIYKKTWSQSVTRSTCQGLRIARIVETSNAESYTPIKVCDTLKFMVKNVMKS